MKLIFEKAKTGSFDDYYLLRCDIINVAWTGFDSPPQRESMKQWFDNQIKHNPDRDIYMAYLITKSGQKRVAGYFYLDYLMILPQKAVTA